MVRSSRSSSRRTSPGSRRVRASSGRSPPAVRRCPRPAPPSPGTSPISSDAVPGSYPGQARANVSSGGRTWNHWASSDESSDEGRSGMYIGGGVILLIIIIILLIYLL